MALPGYMAMFDIHLVAIRYIMLTYSLALALANDTPPHPGGPIGCLRDSVLAHSRIPRITIQVIVYLGLVY